MIRCEPSREREARVSFPSSLARAPLFQFCCRFSAVNSSKRALESEDVVLHILGASQPRRTPTGEGTDPIPFVEEQQIEESGEGKTDRQTDRQTLIDSNYSAVKMSSVKGCASAVLVNATFDRSF